jgi:hypothetical protein
LATGADRDRSIDALLKQRRRPPSPGPAGPCLDAERMASWADGSLKAAEIAAIEEHAADCMDCQALLAAFARTEPLAASSRGAIPWIRWIVPVAAGALAAAMLFWIVKPRSTQGPAPATAVARVEMPPSVIAPPAAATPPAKTEPTTPVAARPAASAPTPLVPGRLPGAVDAQASRDFAQWSAGRSLSINGGLSLNKNTTIDGVPSGEEGSNGAPHITPNVDSVAAVNEAARPTANAAPAASPRAAPVTTPASPDVRGRDVFGMLKVLPSSMIVEFSTPPIGSPENVSSTPVVKWRIFTDGHVDRAKGSGAWEAIEMDRVPLVAGAAPAAAVCWLVGRRGVVLVTSDGGDRFRRADVPDQGDVVSIRSTDALHATARMANGREFATTDGGRTWR